MNIEKEINRIKKELESLTKKVDTLLTEQELQFPCFLPGTNRECTWRCMAHSEHAEWKIKEGWKDFKTKVITKGHCKVLKLMEEGNVPGDFWNLVKG